MYPQSMLGQRCKPQDDVVVLSRCRNKAETNKGIVDGAESVRNF